MNNALNCVFARVALDGALPARRSASRCARMSSACMEASGLDSRDFLRRGEVVVVGIDVVWTSVSRDSNSRLTICAKFELKAT